jgi:hypothetical protein
MVNQKSTLRSEAEKKRAVGKKTAAKQWKSIPKDPSEQEKFDMALSFQTHLNKSAKEGSGPGRAFLREGERTSQCCAFRINITLRVCG